ncbi:MAG: hypothetical protein ACK41Z_06555 [Sediminibacterium sp.]
MEKKINKILKRSTCLDVKYCAVCGVLIADFKCNCNSGSKIMQLLIPPEYEDFFWMDGSVKAELVHLQKTTAYENRKF